MMASAAAKIVIDGSVMEGGGQILRIASALSCLTCQPITVQKIRAGRSKPGLRPQHLSGLRLLKDLCSGELQGGTVGSTEITFIPSAIKAGRYLADTQTAGSVVLLMQVSMPCMLFAVGPIQVTLKGGTNAEMAPQIDYTTLIVLPCTWLSNGPVHIILRGGTDTDMAPPLDHYIMVFQPMIKRFGVHFECDVKRRGYYPKGGGEIQVRTTPVQGLQPVDITDVGQVIKIEGRGFVAGVLPIKVARSMAETASGIISRRYPSIPVHINAVQEASAVGNGTGIIVVAETSTGCKLAGSGLGKKGVAAEQVGKEAAEMLLMNLDHGGCVDEYLQDQLIILMALANGRSRVLTGPLSLHTKTAIHVTEKLTKAKFKIKKESSDGAAETNIIECEGVGLQR